MGPAVGRRTCSASHSPIRIGGGLGLMRAPLPAVYCAARADALPVLRERCRKQPRIACRSSNQVIRPRRQASNLQRLQASTYMAGPSGPTRRRACNQRRLRGSRQERESHGPDAVTARHQPFGRLACLAASAMFLHRGQSRNPLSQPQARCARDAGRGGQHKRATTARHTADPGSGAIQPTIGALLLRDDASRKKLIGIKKNVT